MLNKKRHRTLLGLLIVIAILAVLLASGCRSQPRYTSLDIDLLPCERGAGSPRFFEAVEFRKDGSYKYPEQITSIRDRIETGRQRVTDLIVFTHGWNKSPASAEFDYREFICRLHTELEKAIGERKRKGGLLVIGVFWPSTISNRDSEPVLIKPVSYYKIRDRADFIAEHSLSRLYETLGESLRKVVPVEEINPSSDVAPRLHLIGHSFGGRMTIRAMETLNGETEGDGTSKLVRFLTSAELINVVLLNAAMPDERFDWIDQAIARARVIQGLKGEEVEARFTTSTNSYLFNTHSEHDSANKVLFRIASMFNDDSTECAVGACGIPKYPTLCVSDAGIVDALSPARDPGLPEAKDILVWNADAENIVFAHSDIYKGRVARLVSALLYNEDLRCQLNPECDKQLPEVAVCPEAAAP